MKIMVSACLAGINCKYDGKNNFTPIIKMLEKDYEIITVCPEMLGGLPAPRIPVEIVDGKAITRTGENVTRAFYEGAEKGRQIAEENEVSLLILQSRSPTCGVNEIYDGSFTGKKIPGKGVFAKMMTENHFRVIDIEDLQGRTEEEILKIVNKKANM